jgi:flagellar hook-length control protein FliK
LTGAEGAVDPGAPLAGTARQRAAGGGKELPVSGGEDTDESDEAPDIAFAWFGMAPVVPAPAPIGARPAIAADRIELPEGVPLPVPAPDTAAAAVAPPLVEVEAAPGPALPAGSEPSFELPAPIALPADTARPAKAESTPALENPRAAPLRIELPPAREPAAGVQPLAAPVQPLVVPLAAAAIEAPATFRRQLRESSSALSVPTQIEAPRPVAVAATPDAQQPALDMRRQEWMGAMVERIEALRDAAPLRETNIRLAPDALGSVDIAIRHEGDRVHVRITAETAAARTLLAEAQPRLAELAEARGLRLGQTSIDGGAAGHGNPRHAPTPQAAFPSAPASAAGDDTASTEDRIA